MSSVQAAFPFIKPALEFAERASGRPGARGLRYVVVEHPSSGVWWVLVKSEKPFQLASWERVVATFKAGELVLEPPSEPGHGNKNLARPGGHRV